MDALFRNNVMVEAFTPNRVDVALTTASQILLTAPASGRYLVTGLWFNEWSNNNDTVTVYRVASGGSVADTNTLTKAEVITAKSRLALASRDQPLVLQDGDTLRALAGTNSRVNAHVEYLAYR